MSKYVATTSPFSSTCCTYLWRRAIWSTPSTSFILPDVSVNDTENRFPSPLSDQELFDLCVDLQVDYPALETRLLEDALQTILAAETRGRVDHARLLRERAVDVFGVAEEAIARCTAFTHGYGALGLAQSLDRLFSAFAEASKVEINWRRSGHGGQSLTTSASGEDLSDLDYTAMIGSKLRSGLVSTTLHQQRGDPMGIFMASSNCSCTPPPPLLVAVRTAISDLAKTCQEALQETILSPLHKHLATYASSALRSTPRDPKAKRPLTGDSALSEVQVPTFSLSPRSTMQHVAEGLLNLPRLFEVYAGDDALAFSLETLPFISADLLRGLADPTPPPDTALTPSGISHTRRSPSLTLKGSSGAQAGTNPAVLPPMLTPEAVSATWLSSLGISLVSKLTSEVLPRFGRLTPAGAVQLCHQIYLSNIVMVLNVESAEWREWFDNDDVGTDARS
ncbi:hypothetical protein C8Q80DRAFT_1286048 [Daedaleopsis nitida]|nr:hypothetical protein C8Q80DRAFT_1286048 [Daedaleopsis nitida]